MDITSDSEWSQEATKSLEYQRNPAKGDEALAVTFYTDAFEDEVLTKGIPKIARTDPRVEKARELGLVVEDILGADRKETEYVKIKGAGRPIFLEAECVEIRKPGDRLEVRKGRIKGMQPDPRIRFAAQYQRWKAGAKQQRTGTPLAVAGLVSTSRAKEYEYFNVYTVEQLAALSDASAGNIRGSLAERQAAQEFLDAAKGRAPAAAAAADRARLEEELRSLRDQIADLKAAGVAAPAPKRRGRPPKAQAQE